MPSLPLPFSGTIDNGAHYLPQRVYWGETDAGGVVYHAAYLNFAERGRVEFLRNLGLGQEELRKTHGLIFAVRSCQIDYKAPARLDDALLVETQVASIGGASLDLSQTILKFNDNSKMPLVKLDVTLVAISENTKAIRIPDAVREKFSKFVTNKEQE